MTEGPLTFPGIVTSNGLLSSPECLRGPGRRWTLAAAQDISVSTRYSAATRFSPSDLESPVFSWHHPNVEIMQGDLLKMELQAGRFDLILNCSTVEHVGLSGRYGVVAQETNGDLKAMGKLRTLLKPSGKMLMTIPCGRDAVIVPWHRVYGEDRLPKLLSGYEVEEQNYWLKHGDNRWYSCSAEAALSYAPTIHPTIATRCSYALGCFVLRPAPA